jgi:phosphatidate cytidylyltransferase
LYLLWLYIATWAYDTGGYFAGRWWGKHHFAPLASPKKSLEGCIGGFALVLIGLFLLWKIVPFFAQTFSLLDVLALSVLLSLFGQLGDLVESLIKRSLSAKDSGSLLPGHGGVFDRIDSLLFNAPILFYYLILFHQ